MAQEVLAIPISNVASKYTFNRRGRLVSPYHSCLMPRIVEVLVCTQYCTVYFFMRIPKELDEFKQDEFI